MIRAEWDESKRRINLRCHGIDFADLEELFNSETYTQIDDRFDYGELRYLTLGLVHGRVLAVSHTENDEVIRVISARKAEKHEEEIYFTQIRD